MAYFDTYAECLHWLQATVGNAKGSRKRVAMGYTSNLDILLEWDIDVFNSVLEDHLKVEPCAHEGETIDSVEDFARIVSSYILRGLGGEIDISNSSVCHFLEQKFRTRLALGGTCAQGSAALGVIGFPVVAHLTDRSGEVSQRMNYPNVSVVSKGQLVSAVEGASNEPSVKHIIVQYNRGDVVRVLGKEHVIPASNRLILDYDDLHKGLSVDKEFMQYVEENAADLCSYSISGFSLIVDATRLGQALDVLEPHYARIKQVNPQCVIYLEGAHYLSPSIQQMTFDRLSKHIDILGVNEEELVDLVERHGVAIDCEDLGSILRGLEAVITHYPVKGIVLHTKDYALYYGHRFAGLDMERGLTIGNLMATTKARLGHYGTVEDCKETLALDLSHVGLAFAKDLESVQKGRYTCIVPSRYMKNPHSTIGLGDTFVAGMQMGFVDGMAGV